MKKRQLVQLSIFVALSLMATTAMAQEAKVAAEAPRVHSVNLSPLGVAFGSYALNYEYLLDGYHGFLVEGNFSSSSDDDTSNTSGGALLGYRLHWSGEQNSGFIGLSAAYQMGSGDGTVTVNNEKKTFQVDSSYWAVTANVGRRWAWDWGLNITFRIGAGYGNYSFSTPSDDPDAQLAVDLTDALLTILPVAFEGELSVGYNF